jgi:hypothetical protein
MKRKRAIQAPCAVIAILSAALISPAAHGAEERMPGGRVQQDAAFYDQGTSRAVTVDTLWIYVSDFENETGWTAYDMSGTAGDGRPSRPTDPTGVFFRLGRCGIDFDEPYGCQDCTGWMYAAVDSVTGRMVSGEDTWLISPAINVAGAEALVGRWDMWVDCPEDANDYFDVYTSSGDDPELVTEPDSFADEERGHWFGGPRWMRSTDIWDSFGGDEWLSVCWRLWNQGAPEGDHGTGVFLGSFSVGVLSGDLGTRWSYPPRYRLKNLFGHQLSHPPVDTARVFISDSDGVVSARLVASGTGGNTWSQYSLIGGVSGSDEWLIPLPAGEMAQGNRIRYYLEAEDALGNVSVYPSEAPDRYLEMRILPTAEVLIVDKHNEIIPAFDGEFRFDSEYYYREALDILGYDYDWYDVFPNAVPAGRLDGLSFQGLLSYDTILWITGDRRKDTVTPEEQLALIQWLGTSTPDSSRCLLVTGNSIGYDIGDSPFYQVWLASRCRLPSHYYAVLTLGNSQFGSREFMTYDDERCALAVGCPQPTICDVVGAGPSLPGAEDALDYSPLYGLRRPAGVAYIEPAMGYRVVNLGFGMEYMRGEVLPGDVHTPGIHDRVDLLGNILDFFGVLPTEVPTSTGRTRPAAKVSCAFPNPTGGAARIAYTIPSAGSATVAVYDVAGRLVSTLLDERLEAGSSGEVTWDGRDRLGRECGSGVYFFRINAPGISETRMVFFLRSRHHRAAYVGGRHRGRPPGDPAPRRGVPTCVSCVVRLTATEPYPTSPA